MVTRVDLYRLVDALSDMALGRAAQYLERLNEPLVRALLEAPLDDESETEAERAAVEEAYADRAAGRGVSHEDIRREFGL